MCDNCKNCKGNVGNIALAFKENSVPVQAVFTKYGMAHMEPTPQNALTGTIAYGAPFAKEVALAAAGVSAYTSNFTDEQNSNNLNIASTIFDILGTGANAGIDIAKGIFDIKNAGKPGYTPTSTQTQTTPTGQPQVVYMQPPTQPQQQSGFGSTQLVLLLVAGAAFVAVLFLIRGKKQG